MWEPWPLATLGTSTACNRNIFNLWFDQIEYWRKSHTVDMCYFLYNRPAINAVFQGVLKFHDCYRKRKGFGLELMPLLHYLFPRLMLNLSAVYHWHSAYVVTYNPIYDMHSFDATHVTVDCCSEPRASKTPPPPFWIFVSVRKPSLAQIATVLSVLLYMLPIFTLSVSRTFLVHSAKSTGNSTVSTYKAMTIIWMQMGRDMRDFRFSRWWLRRLLYSGCDDV
jgi:hypothetical protein